MEGTAGEQGIQHQSIACAMNRRSKPLVFAGAVLLLVVVLFLWLRPKPPFPSPIVATVPDSPDGTTRAAPPSTTHPPTALPQSQRQIGGSKFSGLAILSASPIEFYGKVIDQDGKPLPGVEAIGGTGSTTGFMQQETRSYSNTSDANGVFTFRGFHGDVLIIELKKDGYNFDSDRNRFRYSGIDPDKKRFTPDRKNPVVFQMWKALGAEPLISYYGRSVDISSDGTPVLIDLEKGTKAKDVGDLRISVTWGSQTPGSNLFDWSAKIEVPEGGIIESVGDVMFLAPLDGYQKSLEYHFAAQDRQMEMKRVFYIKSRNGSVFSRAELSLQNQQPDSMCSVYLRVQLNPKPGSRNLEPAPAKPLNH